MKQIAILILVTYLTSAENLAEDEFISANNRFASSIYKKISKSEPGNFLVSPFSAETILSFVQSGCKGETAEELRNGLHLPEDKEKIESALKSLLPKFKGNQLYSLHSANKMYVKEHFHIKEEFGRAAAQVYQADSETIDFTKNIDAAKTMNSWIEKQTNNKIQNLINSNNLNNDTRAVLLNALYFKANWSNPFILFNTKKENFYKTATDVVQVDTLHHDLEDFNYHESPDLKTKFLELPFQGNEASMVIVLPNARDGLAALEDQIDTVFAQKTFHLQYLNVALPKFQIESKINFKEILKSLGVTKIFDGDEADLSGIAGKKGDLVINQVFQKSFVDVSEEGVEAATAPDVELAVYYSFREAYPENFIANHPFIFYIKVKDLIVFAGRVSDPKYKVASVQNLVRERVFRVKD